MAMKKRVSILVVMIIVWVLTLALVGCEEPDFTGEHRDWPSTGTNTVR